MNISFLCSHIPSHDSIGIDTGWHRAEFFVFLGTTWIINSIIQLFLMPNAEEFSELIRGGGLDFALLKTDRYPISVSFRKVHWSALSTCWLVAD